MPSTPVATKASVLALVRQHLLAQTTVVEMVGANVRVGHAETPDSPLSYPLVILDMASGVAGYQGGLQRWVMEAYAYSDESQAQADKLYDKLYLGLQAERLWDPSGAISTAGYAREVERPESGYNEQTRSWFCRGGWVVMVAG